MPVALRAGKSKTSRTQQNHRLRIRVSHKEKGPLPSWKTLKDIYLPSKAEGEILPRYQRCRQDPSKDGAWPANPKLEEVILIARVEDHP